MDGWVFLNNQIIPADEATISPLDLSILRGYGVTDYLRTYGGIPFYLNKHLMRFQSSAKKIGLTVPKTIDEITKIIGELLHRSRYTETSLKLILTGGLSQDQYLPVGNSTFFIVAYPFLPFPKKFFEQGVKIITECYARPFSTAKTTNYLSAIMGMKKAQKNDAVDVLFHDEQGSLLETGTANFFGFKGNKFITPNENILKGITREIVLEILKKHFSVEERKIHKNEISQFEGAFLTSSNKEVMPINQINQHTLPIPEELYILMENFSKKVLQNI